MIPFETIGWQTGFTEMHNRLVHSICVLDLNKTPLLQDIIGAYIQTLLIYNIVALHNYIVTLYNSIIPISSVSEVEWRHMLFGRPRMMQGGEDYCLLPHQGFVSGYSQRMLMPLWSSFNLDKPVRLWCEESCAFRVLCFCEP